VTFDAAELNILDVRVVVVFVLDRPSTDLFANLTGLIGNVVAVWPDEFGRTRFLAPSEEHAFFRVASYHQLQAQIDTTLTLSFPSEPFVQNPRR
jgi:hypothetical protein